MGIFNVTGKSVKDLLNIGIEEFNKLTKSDLQKVVGRLVSAGNKRLRSFERTGESSPATRYIEKSGGKFSTRGKDINALRAEFARAKNFFQSQTGTVKGWRKAKKETLSGLKKHGISVDESQFNDLWQAYQDLKDLSPEVASRGMKYAVLKDIANRLVDNRSPDDIAVTIHENLSRIYEQQAELMTDDGVSGFFEI